MRFGTAFYPEVGDEVIVSFMNEDPRFPVVLGSVYSAKLAPAYPPDKKNKIKGLKTRSKMELTFDDEDKIVTIKTPGGHVFVMDDKAGLHQHHGQQQELDGLRQAGHHHRQRVEDRHQGKGQHLDHAAGQPVDEGDGERHVRGRADRAQGAEPRCRRRATRPPS